MQLVKKFPAFYETRRFITAFASARHMSLSSAGSFQSIPPQPTSWRSILILSSHLRLVLPRGLLPSGFPTKTLYTPLPYPPYALHAPPISFFLILSPAQYWVRNTLPVLFPSYPYRRRRVSLAHSTNRPNLPNPVTQLAKPGTKISRTRKPHRVTNRSHSSRKNLPETPSFNCRNNSSPSTDGITTKLLIWGRRDESSGVTEESRENESNDIYF